MSIHKLFKTPTVNAGIFWRDVVDQDGWRVQYNATFDNIIFFLKPYRLLDPEDYLCASADSAEELAKKMPSLIESFKEKDPLFTSEDILIVIAELIFKNRGTKK